MPNKENRVSLIDSIKSFREFCIEDSIDENFRNNPPSIGLTIAILIIPCLIAQAIGTLAKILTPHKE